MAASSAGYQHTSVDNKVVNPPIEQCIDPLDVAKEEKTPGGEINRGYPNLSLPCLQRPETKGLAARMP
jgi:hypothetical protein